MADPDDKEFSLIYGVSVDVTLDRAAELIAALEQTTAEISQLL